MFSAQLRNNKKIIEYGGLTGVRKALFIKLEQKNIGNTNKNNIKLETSL